MPRLTLYLRLLRCRARAALIGIALAGLLQAACSAEPAELARRLGRPLPTPAAPAATGAPVSEIRLELITEGLRRPIYLTHAGDERLFVAEQRGAIRIIQDGLLLPEPFLDISDRLSTDGSERGLLGLAFHPHYGGDDGTGTFFVVYTNPDGNSELTRFTVSAADPNRADPASASLVLLLEQPFGNHNGGQLAFGPDGYLYAGFGDGGAVGDPRDNAQDPTTMLGAILRLDVDSAEPYAVPPDNPFIDSRGTPQEAWHIGLRNPWAFSFDPASGDLYIADVGQEGPEEINFAPAGSSGLNFGWPYREGTGCYEGESCRSRELEPPILTYEHDEGCAVIGGFVYRGLHFPALTGNYFFSDFCRGIIWTLRYDGESWVRSAAYDMQTDVSTIGQDAAGELYVVGYHAGAVWQIQAAEER